MIIVTKLIWISGVASVIILAVLIGKVVEVDKNWNRLRVVQFFSGTELLVSADTFHLPGSYCCCVETKQEDGDKKVQLKWKLQSVWESSSLRLQAIISTIHFN